MAHTDRLDARQGGLRARIVRTDHALELGTTGAFADSKHTSHTAQAPIERKLSAGCMLREARPVAA